MKKKVTIILMILVVLITVGTTAASSVGFYKKMIKREKIGKIREYWNEDITCEILQNRGDDIIVEKIIGTVIDKKKNGRVMNTADPKYNYISYKGVKGARKGDVILTICIYTPGNSYEDDVCERFDYIIDKKTR